MKTFERIASETVEADKVETPFLLNGVQYDAGDYLVKNAQGALEGAKAAEFEANFRARRKPSTKTWSRKKKAPEGSTETPTEQTQTDQAAA